MTGYLLDTNHLGAALDGTGVAQRLHLARKSGQRVGTCAPVLCELATGIAQTAERKENWRTLGALPRQIRVWPIDLEIAHVYGEIYHDLRSKGRCCRRLTSWSPRSRATRGSRF